MLIPYFLLKVADQWLGIDAVWTHNRDSAGVHVASMFVFYVLFVVAWYQFCYRTWDWLNSLFRRSS